VSGEEALGYAALAAKKKGLKRASGARGSPAVDLTADEEEIPSNIEEMNKVYPPPLSLLLYPIPSPDRISWLNYFC